METGLRELATLAGGCFWCLEAVFLEVKGVLSVTSGYTGGVTAHPSYAEVCAGTTGHAEAVQVVFEPRVISYRGLLEIFFSIHDPTTLNRQGQDVGTQYRSAIFVHSPEQEVAARAVMAEFEQARVFPAPLVTEVVPAPEFWPAEDYHQNYFARNPHQPYCLFAVSPKVEKFRRRFGARFGFPGGPGTGPSGW